MANGKLNYNLVSNEDATDFAKAYFNRNQIFEDDSLKLPTSGSEVQKFGEEDIVKQIIKDIESSLRYSERDFVLPGLRRNLEMIIGFVANFKQSEMPSRDIHPFVTAKDNDIAVGFGRDEIFGLDNWEQTGVGADSQDIIPQAGGAYTLNDEEWAFFTGDFLELNSQSIVTAVQYEGLDGEDWDPEDVTLSVRGTDIQVATVSGGAARETIDLNAKSGFSGDLELVPVSVVATKGSNLPSLT